MLSAYRFLIVVFDSLRPDCISASQTPNLYGFCQRGAVFSESRAVFPTLTRVNKVSLVTGTVPASHGILFNAFYDPHVFEDRIVDIGDMDIVLAADAEDNRLITATTLGEILFRCGRKLAVVHTGKTGAPWLLNYRGAKLGHCHFSIHGPDFSTPFDLAMEIVDRLGGIPESGHPNLPRLAYAVTAFLEVIYPRIEPDVTILWLNEPDHASHDHAVGSNAIEVAIRGIDALFGRILAWWASKGQRDGVQIIAMSDHGYISGHTRLDINGLLNHAGFPASKIPSGDEPMVSLPGSVGSIHLEGSRKDLLPNIVDWMQHQDWCGHLFTDGPQGTGGRIPGTFAHALVGTAHRRAPDLIYTLKSRPGGDGCFYDSAKLVGSAQHGGLNPLELRNLLVFGGSAFAEAFRSSAPVGIVDIAPTMLDLMGLTRPTSMTGRPLREAYAASPRKVAQVREHLYKASKGDYTQGLRIYEQGPRRYIGGGWLG